MITLQETHHSSIDKIISAAVQSMQKGHSVICYGHAKRTNRAEEMDNGVVDE